MDVTLYDWNPHAAATALTMAGLLVLGVSVVIRERYSLVSRAFLLMLFTASVWFFAFSWMYCARDEAVALWWAKAAYLVVPFICAAMYHFTLVVLGIYKFEGDKLVLALSVADKKGVARPTEFRGSKDKHVQVLTMSKTTDLIPAFKPRTPVTAIATAKR